jgi:alkylated DNA nucleotide flippase Atl1
MQNPFESLLKGADKLINGELPSFKTANSTSPTSFKATPASEILNPKPAPAPKPSLFTTKTPEQQVAEINAGIKSGKITTPKTNTVKTPDFSSGIPVLQGGQIKPATGKETKPTKAGDFMSGLFGEAQKIVGGDPFERAEVKEIEKRTGIQQPFFESIRSEGLLPSLGKTDSEKMQARYEALFENGVNSQRAKEIAMADVLRNKNDLKNPNAYLQNREKYDSLKITPEEEKAMRWTKIWEVAQLGLDTIGNMPALGSLKFLRNTGKAIAETDDIAKISKELLETGMPENVVNRVAPDFVKITDEKKVAQRIEDIATALKADPKAFGDKVVKQYPETVTQIAKLTDPKAIEEILYTTGVDKAQIPAMAKVLSQTDNPKRVTNLIEGFTKLPEKKVALPVKRLETPIESERVQNVLRTKTPEEISNIQNIVSKEKNLVDLNTTKFDNVIEDANANRPESYKEILEGWSRGEFKPIEAVKRADGTLFIEDGRHRLLLAQEMGIKKYPIKITRNEAKKSPLEVVLSKPAQQKVSEVEEKIAKLDEDEFYSSMNLENERQALDDLKERLSEIDLDAYKRLSYKGADLAGGADTQIKYKFGKKLRPKSESFNKVARQLEDFGNKSEFGGAKGDGIQGAIEMVDDYIARESAYRAEKKLLNEKIAIIKAEKKQLQQEVSKIQKAEVANVESQIKEEKFLNQQAEKTQKMIEEEKIAKIKAENRAIKNEEIKKQLEETQKRLLDEKAYKQRYKELVSMARRPEFSNNSIGNRLRTAFRRTMFPIKNLDEKTQTIFRDWKRQLLVTRELANEQFLKLNIPKEQGMKIINDFQAGRKTEFTEQIKKIFDDLFKQAQEKGFDFRYRENYLPQVYKETPAEIREKLEKYFADQGLDQKMIQDYLDGVIELPEDVVKTLKLNPSFEKQRTFPTYEVAQKYGLTPKYENPAQLASHYKEQMEIAVANKNFIKELVAEGKVLPEADAPKSWTEIKLQVEGNRYFAKEEFAEIINGQMREADKLGIVDLAVKGVAKTSKFMQEVALSAGVPKTSVNFFAIGQAIKALTAGDVKMAGEVLLRSNFNKASIKFFQDNANVIKEMASEGVDVSKRLGDYKDMYETLSDKLAKKEYKNAIGVAFSDLFNEKTFASFMPQMQISNYKQVYAKAIKDGMSPEQARKFSADVTRKFFGLFEDVGRSEGTNDGLTALFFAPRFREGMINVLMNNIKSVTSEFRNPIYYKNRRLVLGMALTYGAYNAINKQLNGNYMFDNEPGKEFALKIPYGQGKFVYVEFMPSFLAFARSLASGFINLATGNTDVATQKLGSVFSMPIKTTTDIISNSDYFDRPIYKESDEGTVKAQKIAKYAGLSFAHPYVKEVLKQIDEKNKVPLWQSLSIAMELPLKYSDQQKINTAKYYENLNNFNKQNAQIKERNQKEFQPTFDKVQKLKEEGKIEEAKAIVDALSDYEYEFYKTMLKSTKAKATNQNKIDLLPLYEQIQQLKSQNRIEEASELVDSLSEDDYKAYVALKKSFSTKPEISVSDE